MTTTTKTWYDTADDWLTQDQQLNNAQLVADHFKGTDWKKESIAALCGNMAHESSLNPNIYEFGYNHSLDRGYGLVQWTPASKYIDWANANGLPYDKGDSQLARMDYEVNQNIQWIADGLQRRYGQGDKYDFSFADFRANTGAYTVEELTEAFMWNYEGPAYSAGTDSLSSRQSFARLCFDTLDWTGTGTGTGGGTLPRQSHVQGVALPSNQYEKEGTLINMAYVLVKTGDSLSKIAKDHGVDINTIKKVRYEEIPNKNNISIGDVVIVPTSKIVIAQKTAAAPVYYTVKPGDSLTKIAQKYNTALAKIQDWNKIPNANLIKVGQKLRVK
jgi:LysM repeat protein